MARNLLWASLALAPFVFFLNWVVGAGDVVLFVLSACALIPLAWLIGEATEHAGEHTGPGIGGFLNATFGNAPELIIALLAISQGLPNVVRGSLAGSVASNILLVLGVALAVGRKRASTCARSPSSSGSSSSRRLRSSSLRSPASTATRIVIRSRSPASRSRSSCSSSTAMVILDNLRRHRRAHQEAETEPHDTAWSLPASLVVLGIATIATAFVSEILVHTLDHFADAAHLSELFVSAVIVAIVGNAAEHGGAIVIARRGKMKLATEIAVSSSAQVSMLVVPAVCLLSFVVKPALPLAFRPIELIAMGASAFFVAIVIRDGWVRRWEGTMLIAVYAVPRRCVRARGRSLRWGPIK